MRIDSLSQSPDRAGRYLVRLGDGSTMRLYRQTLEDFGLYSGMELTEDTLAALRKSAGEMSAKMRAVRIVTASGVSQKDLEQRLVQKGEDPDHAKAAVEWMADLNLVDDRQTARQIVERCIRQGYGPARARQMLYEKQIPREFWEEAMAGYPDQSEYIFSFLETRLEAGSDRREIKRAVDALIRRGHSYGAVRKCLDALELDWEEET